MSSGARAASGRPRAPCALRHRARAIEVAARRREAREPGTMGGCVMVGHKTASLPPASGCANVCARLMSVKRRAEDGEGSGGLHSKLRGRRATWRAVQQRWTGPQDPSHALPAPCWRAPGCKASLFTGKKGVCDTLCRRSRQGDNALPAAQRRGREGSVEQSDSGEVGGIQQRVSIRATFEVAGLLLASLLACAPQHPGPPAAAAAVRPAERERGALRSLRRRGCRWQPVAAAPPGLLR